MIGGVRGDGDVLSHDDSSGAVVLPRWSSLACLTSAWKVNLPLHSSNGSTLSVSYAADLMALHAARPAAGHGRRGGRRLDAVHVQRPATRTRRIAPSSAWRLKRSRCRRPVSSICGSTARRVSCRLARCPSRSSALIATYFFVNTGLVAGAIALSTRQPSWKVWHDNFLWSGTQLHGRRGRGRDRQRS